MDIIKKGAANVKNSLVTGFIEKIRPKMYQRKETQINTRITRTGE